MKKINTKSKLVIKDKKLIKEMDYASTLTDPESLKKIISTALSGTYTAWRRVWRTGVVLPFNLIVAIFVTGEKLSTIMTDWEDTDKTIKRQQMNIINQTGVAKTVDAMTAFCNPGAYAFQKFVEWEDKDLKTTWKKGARQFWDNTAGAFNKNLKIQNDDDDLEENATILYANFVVYCCSILNISINQKAMSSKPSKTKLSTAVSPSNKVSRDSREYKSLLKWFASENFYQLEEVNEQKIGDLNKIETLKSLFTKISKNTVSVKRAAEDVVANNLYDTLNDFFLRLGQIDYKLLRRLHAEFNKSTPSSSSKPESKPESEPESKPENSADDPDTTSDVTYENFKILNTKTLTINKNNIILENNVDKNEAELLSENIIKNFFKFMSNRRKRKIEKEIQRVTKQAAISELIEASYLKGVCILCIYHSSMYKMASIYQDYKQITNLALESNFKDMLSKLKNEKFEGSYIEIQNLYKKVYKYLEETSKENKILKLDTLKPVEKIITSEFISSDQAKSREKILETFDYDNNFLKEVLVQDMKAHESLKISEDEFNDLFEKVVNDTNVSDGDYNITRLKNSIGLVLFLESLREKEVAAGIENNRKALLDRFIEARRLANNLKKQLESESGQFYLKKSAEDSTTSEFTSAAKDFVNKAVTLKASDFDEPIRFLETVQVEDIVKKKKEIIVQSFTKYMEAFNIGDTSDVSSEDKELEGSIAVDSKFSKSALIPVQKEENK